MAELDATDVELNAGSLSYAYVNLLGQRADVTLRDGDIISGVVRSYEFESGDVYLEFAEKKVRTLLFWLVSRILSVDGRTDCCVRPPPP